MRFLTSFIALCSVCVAVAQTAPNIVNKPVKPFKMMSTDGKVFSQKTLMGKAYVLDFWATWCPPCVAAGPTIQSLSKKFAASGFVALGANVSDTGKAVSAYKAKHHYSFPFTVSNDEYLDGLGFVGIPVFIFVDKKGIVREVKSGFNEESSPLEFQKIVANLIK